MTHAQVSSTGSLRTGADYLRSLNDGRQVFVDGEKVADVTVHPAFREAARSVAQLYDIAADPALRDRMKKVLFYTASNISSVVQYGGIGALEGSQACVEAFRTELQARRDLFYEGIAQHAGRLLSGKPPHGAFYAFLRVDPAWQPEQTTPADSRSWAMAQHLITRGRIGCVPGADFGANGEGYIRFCFARSRPELLGALGAIAEILNAEG